jgi:hypothetical protein
MIIPHNKKQFLMIRKTKTNKMYMLAIGNGHSDMIQGNIQY